MASSHGITFSNQDSGSAVPAVHAGAGHNQIADSRKAYKGLLLSAHLHAQAGDLSDSSGDQGGFCVVPIAQSVGDSSCQSDDVFKGGSHLNAYHVRTCVDAGTPDS